MQVYGGSRGRKKARSMAFERLYSRVTSGMCKRGEVCPSEAENRMLRSTRRLHFTNVVWHACISLLSVLRAIGPFLSISKATVAAGTVLPRTWTATLTGPIHPLTSHLIRETLQVLIAVI